ncbi:ATP-dependent RNA helicase dbp6-like [Teratosphaeria destructans]|uniref:ATP-dependent RNA helicase n=1 Tax=Teratosphaeria destructans TaxID=418781 RepID=A0A9W7SKW8_9PEZI|nr:ATP-dependent RNA helicase dbp6-like [Teratosphaeria destructans]
MPPLYKRFIPPKPAAAASTPAHVAVKPSVPAATLPHDAPAKRKRERSSEEMAERKAKKLRKKGHDVPAVTDVMTHVQEDKEGATTIKQEVPGQAGTTPKPEPSGEFAHVKSDKKRHKLEKEARKARKAAERSAKGEGPGPGQGQVPVGSPVHVTQAGATTGEDVADVNGPVEAPVAGLESAEVKKRKERRKERTDSVEGEVQESGGVTNAKPDKKQRRRKARDAEDDGDSVPAVAGQEGAPAEDTPAKTGPKKRRHKLEAVLQDQPVAETPDGGGDHHLRKHGGVWSKFQTSIHRTQQQPLDEPTAASPVEKPILRDLEPIPLPEKDPTPEFVPDAAAIPTWLARPHIVSAERHAPFDQLNLDPTTVKHLSALGFKDALPVQQALVPLLLPPGLPGATFVHGTDPVLPDLAVSAATGSGKTLAYLLPMIEALKQAGGSLGRLRGLIVVPTRELVVQVAAVAESLAKGSPVTVGMATATGKLKDEQDKLIRRSQKHDPESYAKLMKRAHRRNYPPVDDDEFDDYLDELERDDGKDEQRLDDAVHCLIDHVPTYHSTVDILVCTPGRLLEHIGSTLGFTLSYLEWLVLDEADKLLDQQYDGFLEIINAEISRPRGPDEQDGRERYLRAQHVWDEQRERRVRKVVLSATMTRDISKLSGLELFRPRMVVVRGKAGEVVAGAEQAEAVDGVKQDGETFELPRGLVEYCVPVGDGSEKPLYLVKLLEDRIMPAASAVETAKSIPTKTMDDEHSDSVSSSDSDSDSDSNSDLTDSSSDTSISDRSTSSSSPTISPTQEPPIHPSRAALLAPNPSTTPPPTILIFTSSTESALRLAHLLQRLKPQWEPYISTLTKTHPPRQPRQPSHPTITISTDRAARGLDRRTTHVLQYDVPRSLTSYVHRVGRTARAGRAGEAWTLYSHREARWFLHTVVAPGCAVRRARGVEKVRVVVEEGEGSLRGVFERVLEGMRGAVFGNVGGGR